MHTVTIDGNDLSYFASITRAAMAGEQGELTSVQLAVHDNGRITLSTNGYTSEQFGRSDTPLASPTVGQVAQNLTTQGHGNPYANAPQEDLDEVTEAQRQALEDLSNKDRIRLLESGIRSLWAVVHRAEERLGTTLRS